MGSTSPSKKGQSSSSKGAGGQDKAKVVKIVFAAVVLLAVPVWLLAYFDVFKFSKPEPAPAPDSFIEQLPEPERERTKKQIEKAQEQIESGEEIPANSGA